MIRRSLACLSVVSLLALAAPVDRAIALSRVGPAKPVAGGTPVVGPPIGAPRPVKGAHHPVIWIEAHVAPGSAQSSIYPSNFVFADRLGGTGFQPNEQVTLTVAGLNPTSVAADYGGAFTVIVHFAWTFCGAGAVMKPGPTIAARGEGGSSAHTAERNRPCPVAFVVHLGSAANGKGDIVQGVGFQIAEHVTVLASNSAHHFVRLLAHTTADAFGRVHVTIPTLSSTPCGRVGGAASLLVQGDNGTRVTASFPPTRVHPACPARGG